jgi:hypothetical protein
VVGEAPRQVGAARIPEALLGPTAPGCECSHGPGAQTR